MISVNGVRIVWSDCHHSTLSHLFPISSKQERVVLVDDGKVGGLVSVSDWGI